MWGLPLVGLWWYFVIVWPAPGVPELVPASANLPYHLLSGLRPACLAPLPFASPTPEQGGHGKLTWEGGGDKALLLKSSCGRGQPPLSRPQARQVAYNGLHAFHRPWDSLVQGVQCPPFPSSWEDNLPASSCHNLKLSVPMSANLICIGCFISPCQSAVKPPRLLICFKVKPAQVSINLHTERCDSYFCRGETPSDH